MLQTKKHNRDGKFIIKPQSVIKHNENMGIVNCADICLLFFKQILYIKSVKWINKLFFHLLDISICSFVPRETWKKPTFPNFKQNLIHVVFDAFSSETYQKVD